MCLQDPRASYDVNNHDEDPMPRYDLIDSNRHGTRCAGEVAAEGNNSICAVGVAHNAGIGGKHLLLIRLSFSSPSFVSATLETIDCSATSWLLSVVWNMTVVRRITIIKNKTKQKSSNWFIVYFSSLITATWSCLTSLQSISRLFHGLSLCGSILEIPWNLLRYLPPLHPLLLEIPSEPFRLRSFSVAGCWRGFGRGTKDVFDNPKSPETTLGLAKFPGLILE